ncbi:spermatogenesis-associated protein 6 [Hyalella azteca]|uniref:Spermatogenesis-associated protein 6 n=1 Tax=Hyalella azteca TaxID=294128 RepID=A0A979FQN1_HYAAZ|nr:spermatogenesis-associated protein 6 [Hyalella azteca]
MPVELNKALQLSAEVNVHAVSCPGVWLPGKGRCSLSLCLLGFHTRTNFQAPVFPLLFHEKFRFQRTFLGVRALGALETALERETAYLELVQEGEDEAVLAVFECSVRELLFPATKRRLSYSGMDLDLLMEPTRDFPGIISPKVEVSTRSTVSETRSPMHDCETDNVSFGHSSDRATRAVYKAVTAADDAELPADAQIDQQRGGNSESRAARRLPAASDSPATPKSARTAGLTSRHRSRSEGNLTDIQYGQLASRYGGSRPNSGTRTNARLARLDDAHDATITVLDDDACQHCAGAHSVLSCTTCRAYRRLYPDSARSPHPRRVLRQPPQPGTARARVRRRYLADVT